MRKKTKNYHKCTRYKKNSTYGPGLNVRYKKGKGNCKGDCKIVKKTTVQRKSALSDILKNKDKNTKKYKNMYLQSSDQKERYRTQ
jgi:hypothetical protein